MGDLSTPDLSPNLEEGGGPGLHTGERGSVYSQDEQEPKPKTSKEKLAIQNRRDQINRQYTQLKRETETMTKRHAKLKESITQLERRRIELERLILELKNTVKTTHILHRASEDSGEPPRNLHEINAEEVGE